MWWQFLGSRFGSAAEALHKLLDMRLVPRLFGGGSGGPQESIVVAAASILLLVHGTLLLLVTHISLRSPLRFRGR